MYVRELDERTLDRAVALDRMTSRHPVKVGLDTATMDLSKPVRPVLNNALLVLLGQLPTQDRPAQPRPGPRPGGGLGPGEREERVLRQQTGADESPQTHAAPHPPRV